MKINPMKAVLSVNTEEVLPGKGKRKDTWGASSISSAARDPYDLDLTVVPNSLAVRDQTGSVSCPPCNLTNNTCNQTQCCTPDCSGNPNCS